MTQAPVRSAPRHTVRRRKPSFLVRFVGFVGEILITIGILLLLFIVWQVWWTDIGAQADQREAVSALQEEYGTPPNVAAPRQEGPPPEWNGQPTTGDKLGIMRIPRFGYDYAFTIVEGVDMPLLDTGAFGRYPETALPGQVGNFATAAHRQTYGAPMLHVGDLENGDPIIVETPDSYLVYRVYNSVIVDPTEVWTIAPDPQNALNGVTAEPTRRLLTITTCHPPFVSNQRWIINAEFDYWTKRSDGLPEDLIEPAGANAQGVSITPDSAHAAMSTGKEF